jgi:hypothetical protein
MIIIIQALSSLFILLFFLFCVFLIIVLRIFVIALAFHKLSRLLLDIAFDVRRLRLDMAFGG